MLNDILHLDSDQAQNLRGSCPWMVMVGRKKVQHEVEEGVHKSLQKVRLRLNGNIFLPADKSKRNPFWTTEESWIKNKCVKMGAA